MKNIKNLSRRALSLFLSLVMCLSLVNLTAFAAGNECPGNQGYSHEYLDNGKCKYCGQGDPSVNPVEPENPEETCEHLDRTETVIESTCSTAGHKKIVCDGCGKVFQDDDCPKLDHVYLDGKCKYCGQEEPKPECEHKNPVEKIVDATCDQEGFWELVCPDCEKVLDSHECPKTSHEYLGNGKCKYCGKCRNIDENGCHAMEKTVHEATCTEPGYAEYKCPICGETMPDEKLSDPLGHLNDQKCVENLPTCTKKGNYTIKCSRCGEEMGHEEEPMLEPKFEGAQWVPQDGLKHYRYCVNCDGKGEMHVESGAHNFSDWYISREATCTEGGLRVRECEDCGYKEEQSISALGHELEPVLVGATCTDEGKTGVKCARPGCDYSDVVPAASIGHDWKTIAQVEGDHENHKVICGNDASHTKDEPHSWSDWEVIKEATVDEEGLQSRKCEDCGYTESQVIARLTGDNNNNSGNENGDNNNSDTSNGKDDQDIPDTRPPQGGGDENTTPPTVDVEDEQPPLAENPEGNDPIDSAPVEADIPDEQPPLVDWPVDIPDEQPPLAVIPEGEIPVDIPENDTPLAAGPEIDVLDEVVPMVGVPQTGDISLTWYAVAAMSVCGLAVLTLKKREDEEN